MCVEKSHRKEEQKSDQMDNAKMGEAKANAYGCLHYKHSPVSGLSSVKCDDKFAVAFFHVEI